MALNFEPKSRNARVGNEFDKFRKESGPVFWRKF